MSIKDKYHIISIDKYETKEWILKKHYAHRMPSVSCAFGLYRGNILEGVCTFGTPPSITLLQGICGVKYQQIVIELNRLVVNQMDKNQSSFFVSRCLKLLSKPRIIVSYADIDFGHHGYIYQATNWIYTGQSSPIKDLKVDNNDHFSTGHNSRVSKERGGKTADILKSEGYEYILRSKKYRYVYFIGSKKEKKEMLQALKYPILPYPKGDNKKYDASYQPSVQLTL